MNIKENLNKIVKTVEEGASIAVEKSENFIEASKLSYSISSTEEDIRKIYEKVGEQVYKKYTKGSVDVNLKEYCEEIDVLFKSTKKLEKKIRKIKKEKITILCHYCNEDMEKGSFYCPHCGKKQ